MVVSYLLIHDLKSCVLGCKFFDLFRIGIPTFCFLWVYSSLYVFSDACVHAKSHQSRLTLCNPMDFSPVGSSVHRILQARILEWVAMPSSRGSS